MSSTSEHDSFVLSKSRSIRRTLRENSTKGLLFRILVIVFTVGHFWILGRVIYFIELSIHKNDFPYTSAIAIDTFIIVAMAILFGFVIIGIAQLISLLLEWLLTGDVTEGPNRITSIADVVAAVIWCLSGSWFIATLWFLRNDYS